MLKEINKNKNGVSIMIAYVLLLAIAIFIAVGFYTWARYIPNALEPGVDCKEGTSIMISDYSCDLTSDPNEFLIDIKNNGLFNVDGFILHVSDDVNKEPIKVLEASEGAGEFTDYYVFSNGVGAIPLGPNEMKNVVFNFRESIQKIRAQPFIIEDDERIICENIVIEQEISGCDI